MSIGYSGNLIGQPYMWYLEPYYFIIDDKPVWSTCGLKPGYRYLLNNRSFIKPQIDLTRHLKILFKSDLNGHDSV